MRGRRLVAVLDFVVGMTGTVGRRIWMALGESDLVAFGRVWKNPHLLVSSTPCASLARQQQQRATTA